MVVTRTAFREVVQNIATGAVELVPNREVDDVSQLPHTTHPQDDITHPHPSLPRGYGKDCASALCGSDSHQFVAECDPFFENRRCWLDSGYMLTVFTH